MAGGTIISIVPKISRIRETVSGKRLQGKMRLKVNLYEIR